MFSQNGADPLDSEPMPLWATAHIGKLVRLKRPWQVYEDSIVPQMATGVLDGVVKWRDGVRAMVLFDERFYDPSDVVDVPFSYLEVPKACAVPNNHPFASIKGRLGEVAVLWAAGIDVKSRMAKATYYRVKKELLLKHSIDIGVPAWGR